MTVGEIARVRLLPVLRAPLQPVADAAGQLRAQTVFLKHIQGVAIGGPVGNRGTGGDDVQVVAEHIGNDHRDDARRGEELPESAALHLRQMLADGIYLVYLRAAGQQLVSYIDQFLHGDLAGGARQQSGATA